MPTANVKGSVHHETLDKGLALACALIWGVGIALATLVHLAIPSYGWAFLAFVSSISQVFTVQPTSRLPLKRIGYGLVDGGVGGAIFAWLDNALAWRLRTPGTQTESSE